MKLYPSGTHFSRQRKPVNSSCLYSLISECLIHAQLLAAENSILRSKIKGRLILSDEERIRLAELGKLLGKKALGDVGPIFKPDTILKWYRDLIAKKFDGIKNRKKGRKGKNKLSKKKLKKLVRPFAKEHSSWGYDRIVGALSNLGYKASVTAVANILRRNGIPPVRGRDSKWAEFIKSHADVIASCVQVFSEFAGDDRV
jgi:hypothetical protein